MTVTKERAMQMFDRDLEILMDDLRGMQTHYQIADWEAFVFLRKPDCAESYVVKYAASGEDFAKQIVQLHAATPPTTPSAAAMRAAEVKVVLERVARCVYIDEPPCWCNESNDENVEHDTNCLVARDYWASLTILHSTDDALANEVQSRVNLVAEAAVEWYQAGREGGECFDAAEKLSATINSLLELRSKPDAAASSETETEHERLRRTFAYERVRFHHDPNNTYLVVNVTNENMLELEGMAGEFAPSLFKKVGGKETTPFVAATPSPETVIDLARADGYRDGFRHGKQSRAAPLPAAVDDEGECPFCERMVAIEYKMEGRFAAHEAPTDRSHQCVGSYAVASRELLRSGDKS